jgi:hypothetical protein
MGSLENKPRLPITTNYYLSWRIWFMFGYLTAPSNADVDNVAERLTDMVLNIV